MEERKSTLKKFKTYTDNSNKFFKINEQREKSRKKYAEIILENFKHNNQMANIHVDLVIELLKGIQSMLNLDSTQSYKIESGIEDYKRNREILKDL